MRTLESLPMLDPLASGYEADPHAVHREILARGSVARHRFGLAVLGYEQV